MPSTYSIYMHIVICVRLGFKCFFSVEWIKSCIISHNGITITTHSLRTYITSKQRTLLKRRLFNIEALINDSSEVDRAGVLMPLAYSNCKEKWSDWSTQSLAVDTLYCQPAVIQYAFTYSDCICHRNLHMPHYMPRSYYWLHVSLATSQSWPYLAYL